MYLLLFTNFHKLLSAFSVFSYLLFWKAIIFFLFISFFDWFFRSSSKETDQMLLRFRLFPHPSTIVCSSSHILLPRARFLHATKTKLQNSKTEEKSGEEGEELPWKDPLKHAIPQQTSTFSDYREANVDWANVQRLLPKRIIPEMPHRDGTVTPSGWRAPKETAPDLPYYIRRGPNHMPMVFLERRRDELNPKTMDFEYVELVILRGVEGDIFACEQDLRAYLQNRLGHPIGTHVDELKGKIRVKGADRTLIEQFVYDYETEFKLCDQKDNS